MTTVQRVFVHRISIVCDWCGGSGLGTDYGGGNCYGCNRGYNTASELHPEPLAGERSVFARIDLAGAEALATEALARASVWCGTTFAVPPVVQWSTGDPEWAFNISRSLRASIERVTRASGTTLPGFATRSEMLATVAALYARLGDALDPFAPHVELLARGIALSDDSDKALELVVRQ